MSRGLASMPPAYFALVMATGIVSIACRLLAVPVVPTALLWVNCVFFASLSLLTVIRAVRFRDRFRADIMDHARSVGFFTIPAATCVLGSQWIMIGEAWRVAVAFWVIGILAWAVTTYSIFTVLTVKPEKPSLADGINGGWLVSRRRRAVGCGARRRSSPPGSAIGRPR